MNRNVLLIVLVLLSLGLAGGTILFVPTASVEAAIGNCYCGSLKQTGIHTGMGTSCTDAHYNLLSNLTTAAGCGSTGGCLSGVWNVTITRSCYNDEPQAPTWKKEDGYLKYQCGICEDL